jgi:RNA polymerase sigma-70 factor (ECF subfamily)
LTEQRDDDWTEALRAANAGDAAAYARLLRSLAGPVRGFVRRGLERAGAAGDVEDVVQEVLLAIHLKRHTWDPAAPAAPWIWAIARHKLADALRRRGRRAEVDIADFAEVLPAAETEQPGRDRDVQRALGTLAERQRSVVTAVSVEGRTVRETADRLGMTEIAVRVTLHRALRALAARFSKADET